jgi:hypothetical protein
MAKLSEVERLLLYYMQSVPSTDMIPERHYWNILLINEPGKILPIKQKLREEFNPLVEDTSVSINPIISETLIDSGKTKDPALYYELLCYETTISVVNFNNVYRGKVKWDRRLAPRRSKDGWFDLVDKVYAGQIH